MKLFFITIFVISLGQCAGIKFDENTPFDLKKATYTKSGQRIEVISINVVIMNISNTNISFEKIYFRGKQAILTVTNNGKYTFLIGNFSIPISNFQLSSNSITEYGNTPPTENKINNNFNLADNEAIISYKIGDKLKYFRFQNIQER